MTRKILIAVLLLLTISLFVVLNFDGLHYSPLSMQSEYYGI